MMNIITPPNEGIEMEGYIKVFLGGCIGGCDDWQSELIEELKPLVALREQKVQLFNPRWDYKWTSYQQIEWEYRKISESHVMTLWFGKGGMNRIVFYELGKWVNFSRNVPAVVGCDPEFDRKEDVVIQTKLARPDLPVYTNLSDMAFAISNKVRDI